MGSEWNETTWGRLATLEYGKSLRDYSNGLGGYRVFGTNGAIGWHDTPLCNNPGIIIGRKGAYRGVHYSPEPFFVIDTAFYLKPKVEMDTKWAYYQLRTQDINGMDSGSAIPSTSRDDFYGLPVLFPPISEQKAIANILGTLDDKIELNRRMNQTLEGMARAIFKSWFVDFDPVRAKAVGKKPTGLSSDIAKLFPDSFEDSELGEIPKGWKVGSVDDVANINARTLGRHDSLETIDYIEISEVMRGEIATVTRYTRGEEPSRARRRLQIGDTALSTVRPDRGAYFLCLNPPDSLIASTGFAVLSSKSNHWAFLHSLVTRKEIGEELGRLADGGAYPAVRPEVVGKLPVIIPRDAAIIAAYESMAQPLFERTEAGRKESRTLAAIRDALLPKLMSGELRVPDAVRMVGRAG